MFRLVRLKPPHGWNAVAWELGIVTAGVLLALGAQELVELRNWRNKVTETTALLSDEAFANVSTSIEFYAAAPCMLAQVERARRNLDQPAETRQPMPLHQDEFGSFVVRTPLRPLNEAVWSAAQTDGTLSHMGRERVALYSRAFETARKLSETAIIADDRAQGLLVLARPVRFDSATTTHLIELNERLGQSIAFGRLVAMRNIASFKELGLAVDEKKLTEGLDNFSPTLNACRAAKLPVADWRNFEQEKVTPITISARAE